MLSGYVKQVHAGWESYATALILRSIQSHSKDKTTLRAVCVELEKLMQTHIKKEWTFATTDWPKALLQQLVKIDEGQVVRVP